MKKLMIMVAFAIMAVAAQAQSVDSICYFASWLSVEKNVVGYMLEQSITAKNTVVKVPSVWSSQKVNDIVRQKDSNMLYMISLTEVSEEIYKEYILPDSLISKAYTGNTIKDAIETEWRIEYVVLDSKYSMIGQSIKFVSIQSPTREFYLRQMQNYLKESQYTDPNTKIVIMRFEKN